MLAMQDHGSRGKDVDTLKSLCNISGKDQGVDLWRKYQFKNREDVIDDVLYNITRDTMYIDLQE